LIFSRATHTAASNNSYFALKRFLDKQNVKILKLRPVTVPQGFSGYVLEVEQDVSDGLIAAAK
jgi:hypothetical protein